VSTVQLGSLSKSTALLEIFSATTIFMKAQSLS
jgi:hypothetical protein